MNIVKEVSKLVEEECKKKSNPYGHSNSWKHMNHVVKFAKLFAKDIKADEEIVELAAWLHDWRVIQGFPKNHHTEGSAAAEEILKKFNYPEKKIEQVKHCIFAHRSSQNIKPETIEAECVANADAVAHFFEIPDLLCAKYSQEKDMTVEEVVMWLKEKLRRDLKKITFPEAQRIVAPYHKASEIILGI